ncbi:universal stress protein [Ectothiorhodospiraceae bacterium WFHF3C12]|nr:universal stress protein [Ectothiorhodospiraceae bacterium WFHF3C12]
MLQRILAATDGSENAERAVHLAAEIARRFEATLLVAHVLVERPSADEIGSMSTLMRELGHMPFAPLHMDDLIQSLARRDGHGAIRDPADAIRAVADHHLSHAQQLARDTGVRHVETRLLEGAPPANQLVRAAEAERCDLIVIGNRGLGAIKSLFIGSVSRRVTEHAGTSCLTAR